MAHIDTLKTYEQYRAAGLDEHAAKEQTLILEKALQDSHSSLFAELKTWLKEAKEDFASQKLISILGGLILIAMTAGISLLWTISVDLQILKTCGIERHVSK